MVDIACGPALSGCRAELASVACALNAALDRHFPAGPGAPKLIAEAGRFFAERPATLAALVYARRALPGGTGGEREYWVAAEPASGGSAAAAGAKRAAAPAAPAAAPDARALLAAGHADAGMPLPCTVHGPAAGGVRCALPLCEEGDWVVLPRWGAYAAGGLEAAADTPTFYVCSREA